MMLGFLSFSLIFSHWLSVWCHYVYQNMSAFVERPVEVSKTEWLESLQRLQVTRTDMNRLVMNYLVTGTDCVNHI